MSVNEYLKLADGVALDIAEGRLKAGERLPPQRSFAYQRGIAASTASRVYTELLKRGLVVGEVGRGTYVSGQSRRGAAATTDPGEARVDLEFNFPILPGQSQLMAKSLAGLSDADTLQMALRPATSGGTPAARELSARFLTRGGWSPRADGLAFTGGGRQAIATAIATLVPTGARCGVEAVTYPLVKGIAARLGVILVPLAMDEHGVRPDAVEKADREARLSALYVQPVLHNPLGVTMPASRREELARLAETLDLVIIEDAIYGFLADEAPLAALAPDHGVVLDSLSKRVAPGLTLGFVSAPPRLRESVMASIRSGGWGAGGFAFNAAQRLIADGVVSELVAAKREDAKRRQRLAADCLSGFEVHADPRAYHLWLSLPEHWRSQAFVAVAARRGIAITPSSAFAVTPGHAPNAVRLALAAPPIERLEEALRTLAGILHASEQDFAFVE
ncbi:PLP-dependent aminotransferase family protein [Mesorhizobium caraganae]|uniref:aminotransferase-like domain-containing protein n=1 Tax=Mesorhizobium caraganae TaxID=483206 RepID=UPI001939B00A|nr:PLP-dependent aminotransferase family protein [Mesorhizobium caraganae]MBM2713009.1 PLP-dependent aminotransferase family protein [Mesorhizobium caraganae]